MRPAAVLEGKFAESEGNSKMIFENSLCCQRLETLDESYESMNTGRRLEFPQRGLP